MFLAYISQTCEDIEGQRRHDEQKKQVEHKIHWIWQCQVIYSHVIGLMVPCHHVVDLEDCKLERVFEIVHGSEWDSKGLIGKWSQVVFDVKTERVVSVDRSVSECDEKSAEQDANDYEGFDGFFGDLADYFGVAAELRFVQTCHQNDVG